MGLGRTTLAAAITPNQVSIPVVSTSVTDSTGRAVFPAVGAIQNPQQIVMIDDETMFLVQVPLANLLLVRTRGSEGSVASGHDIGATVVTSPFASDFPAPTLGLGILRPASLPDIATYGQDGPITVPGVTSPQLSTGGSPSLAAPFTTVYLAKPSAANMTLAAPSLASNGLTLVITSQSAFAHAVTATGLIDTGAGGTQPLNVITFPSVVGATITLVAQNGLWNVVAQNGTFSIA